MTTFLFPPVELYVVTYGDFPERPCHVESVSVYFLHTDRHLPVIGGAFTLTLLPAEPCSSKSVFIWTTGVRMAIFLGRFRKDPRRNGPEREIGGEGGGEESFVLAIELALETSD